MIGMSLESRSGSLRNADRHRSEYARANAWEVQKYILDKIGYVIFEALEPSHLRSVARSMAAGGAPSSHLGHVRGHLVEICRMAVAEGYLRPNIPGGLKVQRAKGHMVRKQGAVISPDDYSRAWSLLEERERVAFDLVMFAGLRESEMYGLWCSDVDAIGIHSGAPSTAASMRIRIRLRSAVKSDYHQGAWRD